MILLPSSSFRRRVPTASCLLLLFCAMLGLPSRGHCQATVTLTPNSLTTPAANTTTATFDEITPSSFYGTGGTSAAATTNYYTTPTSLANSSANGTATFTGITPATATLPGSFVSGSVSGAYGAPANDTTTYLAIGGTGRSGAVTLTFYKGGAAYVGLNWASPDTYNTITLTFANNTTSTYTPGTTNGNFNLVGTSPNTYVGFTANSASNPITSVQFASTSAAFELDNVSFVGVPEPATWLGGGLAALAAVGVWRQRRLKG